MQKLNRLAVEIVENLVSCDSAEPEAVEQYESWTLDRLEKAFQALEQRAEAAEAKLAEINKQKPAGKFCFEYCGNRWHHIKHGEAQYREQKLPMVPLFTRPAPAVSLAELVPDAPTGHDCPEHILDPFSWMCGAGWFRETLLRNIEEAK